MLLNAFNFLAFLDFSTRTHLPLFSNECMSWVNRLSLHWLLTLSLCLQFLFQLLYLLSEVVDDVLIFTDMDRDQFLVGDCLSLYIFSSICIFQTIYCLFELRGGGGDVRNHHCFAVAAQTVLQQSRQLRVSIRHKKALFVLVAQRVDAVRQSKQRSVNFGTLHQSDSPIFCNSASLRTRQINQWQFSSECLHVYRLYSWFFGDIDLENRMTPRRSQICIGGLSRPSLISSKQQSHDLLGAFGPAFSDSRYRYASIIPCIPLSESSLS